MQYFDAYGDWNITVAIADSIGNWTQNNTETFYYEPLSYFEVEPNYLNWSDVTLGMLDLTADNNITIKNLGNVNITNVEVNATNLTGEQYGDNLSATWFVVDLYPSTCGLTYLEEENYKVTGLEVPRGQSAQGNLTFCLKQVIGVEVDLYKSIRDWDIKAVFA